MRCLGWCLSFIGAVIFILLIIAILIFAMLGNLSRSSGGGNGAVVQNALQMAAHLHNCPPDNLDQCWDNGFPPAVIAYWEKECPGCGAWQNGNLQCVMFDVAAYGMAGIPLPVISNAIDFWANYQNPRLTAQGWMEIPNGTGLPEPGDMVILSSPYFGGVGHMTIVTDVKPPMGGQNGSLTFAQANGPGSVNSFALPPNLVLHTWTNYTVLGYIRHAGADGLPGSGGGISQRVSRVSQLDPAQYASQAEWSTWAYSACSTAAMTEVMNAYGRTYRITNVLQVEAARGDITPSLGLVTPAGIADTVAQFGFADRVYGPGEISLDQVISIANNSTPVIVGLPPDRYAGGHILIVVGGDATSVHLVDSSAHNWQIVSRGQFLSWWGGRADVVTPATHA